MAHPIAATIPPTTTYAAASETLMKRRRASPLREKAAKSPPNARTEPTTSVTRPLSLLTRREHWGKLKKATDLGRVCGGPL